MPGTGKEAVSVRDWSCCHKACVLRSKQDDKISTYQGIYYKENKQGREISLLEKMTLLKVVRDSISEKVEPSETQIQRMCQVSK